MLIFLSTCRTGNRGKRLTADPQPTPKAPARTWQEQVANIQRNLAAKTMSCDRDTHRVNNPIWEEEKRGTP
jgi:hypothetical protein